MYDFYTETNANTTFYLNGKAITFLRAYFCTDDRELAEAMLARCEEWGIRPGDWGRQKPALEGDSQVTEIPAPATIPGRKRHGNRI